MLRKQTFLTLVSCLLILFSSSAVFASEEFEKYKNNPLRVNVNIANWNHTGILQHSIIYENDKFKMWFTTTNGTSIKIAYANSSYGYSWQNARLINVNEPYDFHDPSILNLDNKKMLFYATSINGGTYKIKSAETTNETDYTNSTIILSPSLGWERQAISCPSIYKENNNYYLFYCGWNGSKWAIGLATSNDGSHFNKCQNNPIVDTTGNNLPGGNSFLIKTNSKYYLYFNNWNGSGIDVIESNNDLGCNMQWSNKRNIISRNKSYDQNHIIAPSIIEKSGGTLLYYSGLSSNNVWNLNLTSNNIPLNNNPVILIPGFMGSWNSNAILHNQDVSLYDWKVPSFVKEYGGIIQSLKNSGYEENKDFFVFPYDWRKSVASTSANLNTFLTEKIWTSSPEAKVNIVGHSLGGVIGRVFTQQHSDKVAKIITVGSPHKGTLQAYKPIEAGEIERDNTFLWLAEKLTMLLYKDSFETDRQTMQQTMPVLYDLFPTFNFLKGQNGQMLDINDLSIKNQTLSNHNNNFSQIYSLFNAVYGQKSANNTPETYIIENPNMFDRLFGNYADGKPKTTLYAQGDDVILTKSAREDNDTDYETLNYDHGQIIYKSDAIKKILDLMEVSFHNEDIVEGAVTTINPSLVFLIRSPAEIEASFNGNSYQEEDGIIFIPQASSGNYTLKVKGKERGRYTLIIGQIGSSQDQWKSIEGEITQDPPASQIDTYIIGFNPNFPQNQTLTSTNPNFLFDELIVYLTDINQTVNRNELTNAINNMRVAKQYFTQQNLGKVKSTLLLVHQQIFQGFRKTNETQKKRLLLALEKLENLYGKHLKYYLSGIVSGTLKNDLNNAKKLTTPTQNYLLNKKQTRDIDFNTRLLFEIHQKINTANSALYTLDFRQIEILLKSIQELTKEARK